MQVYIPNVVIQIQELYSSSPVVSFETTAQLIDDYARLLFAAWETRSDVCVQQFNNWHPELIGKDRDSVLNADLKLDDARLALSREAGYENWDEAVARSLKIDPVFENAVDFALAGNLSKLQTALDETPTLTQQTSPFGHRATILNYMGSNGVEMWRQVVPSNICDVVTLLIQKGSDVNATMNAYGGQFDTLAMAETSAHPTDAGIRDELIELLKRFRNNTE